MKNLVVVILGLVLATLVRAQDVPPIAAAADLKFALAEIARTFEKDTGRKLRLSFGSSGNFTHQLEQGAPFELFLSADENYIFRLARSEERRVG